MFHDVLPTTDGSSFWDHPNGVDVGHVTLNTPESSSRWRFAKKDGSLERGAGELDSLIFLIIIGAILVTNKMAHTHCPLNLDLNLNKLIDHV